MTSKEPKDELFKTKKDKIIPFSFDNKVANVFDDMATRSIPNYDELQELIASLVLKFQQKDSSLYDLGCSTGNTILKIFETAQKKDLNLDHLKIIGVDSSKPMLKIAARKCRHLKINWILNDLNNLSFQESSVIIASYVFQFIEIEKRAQIINKIFQALKEKGIFILAEKIISPNPIIENEIKKLYQQFKLKNQYTQLEIKQKEEALKNFLNPISINDYSNLFKKTGFKEIEIIFRNLNFFSLIAIK